MNTRTFRSTLIGSVGVALALASGSALAIAFRITDLGTLGGTSSQGVAINAAGQATGSSTTADGEIHAFLWDGTTLRDLGTLGGMFSAGSDISASGQVTGSSNLAGDAVQHAFLWNGTRMQDLGTLGGASSTGSAINASGQVTGSGATGVEFESHAFLWDGTTMQDLGTLVDGFSSSGNDINDSGQVTGSAPVPVPPGRTHAFLSDRSWRMDRQSDWRIPRVPSRAGFCPRTRHTRAARPRARGSGFYATTRSGLTLALEAARSRRGITRRSREGPMDPDLVEAQSNPITQSSIRSRRDLCLSQASSFH